MAHDSFKLKSRFIRWLAEEVERSQALQEREARAKKDDVGD
jgi:predicted DNA-binding transcriptional regulator AlpA